MDLQEYQRSTNRFAEYPKENELEYLVLGLISELSEFQQYLEACEDFDRLPKEGGDCFWYLSQLANAFDVELSIGAVELDYPDMIDRLASVRKKHIRGDYDFIEYSEKMVDLLPLIVYTCICNLALFVDQDLGEILQTNIDKLNDRKNRGVIKGDGDDR